MIFGWHSRDGDRLRTKKKQYLPPVVVVVVVGQVTSKHALRMKKKAKTRDPMLILTQLFEVNFDAQFLSAKHSLTPTDEALWRKQRKRREAGPPREAFGAPMRRSRCLIAISKRATHFFPTKNEKNKNI